MPVLYDVEHDPLIIDLLEQRLESCLAREGYRVMMEYEHRGGPNVIEFRRGHEIVSVQVQDKEGEGRRLVLECSSEAAMPVVLATVHRLLRECLEGLLRPLAAISADELEQAIGESLEALWDRVRASERGEGHD